jgi:5,6-dimethylbenzimidazole synthase
VSDFSDSERAALYRAIAARRDVRADFTDESVPDEVLLRILTAAHMAPSVGLSQPWRFIVVRDDATRGAVHDAFLAANAAAARIYSGARSEQYGSLRLEGIRTAPVNLCVTCDDAPERGHGLGRQTMPETARYSTVCAIQNLWLAARVEGLGVGWVSILDPDSIRAIFSIPRAVTIVAYLCLGYTSGFARAPDLENAAWEERVPLHDVVDYERYRERPANRED